MAASRARGPAWYFRSAKDLKRLASKQQVYVDQSLIHAFCDGDVPAPPWTPEQARAAARVIHEADATDARLQDGVEFRFFVGGVACKGVEAYRKLVATSAMCAAFKIACESEPAEHGVAPWVTLDTECSARGGGLLKGPSGSVVGASRDDTYAAAAKAAIMVFESGSAGLTVDQCAPLLKLCRESGLRCPLDVQKVRATTAARMVEQASETARELGAGSEDVGTLARMLANVAIWHPKIDLRCDPHLSSENMADLVAMTDAVKMHHTAEYETAEKMAEKGCADVLAL